MRDDIERFVASLRIPGDRKAVVLAELLDHAACAREAAVREGRDGEVAARDAVGNLEALRRSLEAVEAGFVLSRREAIVRGIIAAVAIALVIDHGGATNAIAAFVAVALAAVIAPARVLDLLQAELRAPRVRGLVGRGVPVGAAHVYALTAMFAPFLVWTAMIVVRAFGGMTAVDVPWSAFAVVAFGSAVLLVENVRVRVTA